MQKRAKQKRDNEMAELIKMQRQLCEKDLSKRQTMKGNIDKIAKAVEKEAKQKTDIEMATLIKQKRQLCERQPGKRETMKK